MKIDSKLKLSLNLFLRTQLIARNLILWKLQILAIMIFILL